MKTDERKGLRPNVSLQRRWTWGQLAGRTSALSLWQQAGAGSQVWTDNGSCVFGSELTAIRGSRGRESSPSCSEAGEDRT